MYIEASALYAMGFIKVDGYSLNGGEVSMGSMNRMKTGEN